MNQFHSNLVIDKAYGWKSCCITDKGQVRKVNEDSVMVHDSQAHWVVADGMGGHQAGDLASSMIANNLQPLEQTANLPDFIDKIEDTLIGVNENLFTLAESRSTVIGSTVVGAALHQGHLVLYWVGDSRGYLFRNQRLVQLTTDHTLVQEMVDAGDISAEEAHLHPKKNVITRAVGSHAFLAIDFLITPIEENDIILLCSDGIEKELDDEALQQLFRNALNIETLGDDILSNVLARGGRDNVSFIIIEPMALEDVTR